LGQSRLCGRRGFQECRLLCMVLPGLPESALHDGGISREESDVVERVSGYSFGQGLCLRGAGAHHDDPRVMVVHRQAPVGLRLADIGEGEGASSGEAGLAPRIEEHGRAVLPEHLHEGCQLNLLDPTKGAPDGHAQLVATDVGETRRQEVVGQASAPTAVEAVAVEDDGRGPVPLHQLLDWREVGGVLGGWQSGFSCDVQGPREMPGCELGGPREMEERGAPRGGPRAKPRGGGSRRARPASLGRGPGHGVESVRLLLGGETRQWERDGQYIQGGRDSEHRDLPSVAAFPAVCRVTSLATRKVPELGARAWGAGTVLRRPVTGSIPVGSTTRPSRLWHLLRMLPIETIRLSDGKGEAWIAPARGGMVTRLSIGGEDVLYLDEATLGDPSKNVRG